MQITRRQFTAYLGVLAAGGVGTWVQATEKPGSKTPGPDEIWVKLMEGNKRFVAGKPRSRTLIRTRQELARGQQPEVIVLGCSDSRVSPTLVFDQSLGDLFVIRTAGNIADPIALGSMEYAAEHLHSKVLLAAIYCNWSFGGVWTWSTRSC